jgi:hypothetical protein
MERELLWAAERYSGAGRHPPLYPSFNVSTAQYMSDILSCGAYTPRAWEIDTLRNILEKN